MVRILQIDTVKRTSVATRKFLTGLFAYNFPKPRLRRPTKA